MSYQPITKASVGKRLLVTDSRTGITRQELTILEVSPSEKFFRAVWPSGADLWRDCDEHEIIEELPAKK